MKKGTASYNCLHDGGDGGGEEYDMDGFARKNRKHMNDMKRKAKTQNELWISRVVVSILLGFVLALPNAPPPEINIPLRLRSHNSSLRTPPPPYS